MVELAEMDLADHLVELPGSGLSVAVARAGSGPTCLYLHSERGAKEDHSFVRRLSASCDVIAPVHPGYGKVPLPSWMTEFDDLAYLYLELLREMKLSHVALVGSSAGGFIAAEMLVKAPDLFSHVVLVSPFGIKSGSREERGIADMYALSEEEVLSLSFADPDVGRPNFADMTDAEITEVFQGRESTVILGWEPYMHDPKLARRLKTVQVPSALIWGEQDRLVTDRYKSDFAEALRPGQTTWIPDAGHFPQIERPADTASAVASAVAVH